jgi:hypothetical protein
MMYTLLPNGGPAAAFKLSIFLSPRLEGEGPTGFLQDYTLGNWAAEMLAQFSVNDTLLIELGAAGGPQLIAHVTPEFISGLDPALWDAIFPPPNTLVTPRVFKDMSKRWIRSYPVKPIEQYIDDLYNTVANDYPDEFPDLKGNHPINELLVALGRVKPLIDGALPGPRHWPRPRQYPQVPPRGSTTHPDREIEQQLALRMAELNSAVPMAEIFQAIRFYKRGNQSPYRSADLEYDENLVRPLPVVPVIDFHKALAALGDHPFLLRKLGLIIDCTLEPNPVIFNNTRMHLFMKPGPGTVGGLTPWTQYQINALSGFRPAPDPSGDLLHGLLKLDGPKFDVIQTDPDGNVLKVYDFAVNMLNYKNVLLAQKNQNPEAKTSKAPEPTSVPALRSGGLMVLRGARDDKLFATVARQAIFESSPNNATLLADDVVRGYRIDVWFRGNWYSLCRRTGRYELAGFEFDQPGPDEGYLKAESASSDPEEIPEGQQQPDLYVHETMVAWRNWSLVAAMPGQTIEPVRQPQKRQKEVVVHKLPEPGAGFDIATFFRAERLSLPPLRYGDEYKFRARMVDLAGNSWAPSPSVLFPVPDPEPVPAGTGESPLIRYLRHDPVPAPMLIVPEPFKEGESMETIAIRSRGGTMPAPLPNGWDALFNSSRLRWVAAPKTTVGDAEAHGKFDTLFNQDPDISRILLAKEAGSFDDLPTATIVDRLGNVVDPETLPSTWKKGDPLPDGEYFIHTEDPVLLPYLPDPLAHGVALMPKDGTNSVHYRPFAGTAWPDAEPFKLMLLPAPGPTPSINTASPNLELLVPKGHMLTVRYASTVVPPGGATTSPPEGELDLMARWHGMSSAAGGGQDKTRMHGYQHWMLTPFRTLTLVHAVEKPLRPPTIVSLDASRSLGETFVVFRNGNLDVHPQSTGEVELRARWVDFYDDPKSDKDPYTVNKDGHVLDRNVDYTEDPVYIPPTPPIGVPPERIKHEFGDTKHRWVWYRGIATTRYREFFPHALANYHVLEPHPLYPDITLKRGLMTNEGDEYEFPQGGELLPINVKSSARPEPPEPLYVVPTFKWVDTANGRVRQGRGLRIYLARGWYSTGEDEQLGVVILPSNAPQDIDPFRGYVTQWGSDPMFNRSGPSTAVQPGNFTSDPEQPETHPYPVTGNLRLAESTASTVLFVRVVPFDPIYDPARKLWYVDLVMQPANLFNTFIRLALCRYQEHSLPTVEISKVVRTEFAQLLADRTASLIFNASDITVVLYGPASRNKLGVQAANSAPPGGGPPPSLPGLPSLGANPNAGKGRRVRAQIESRPSGTSGDLGWEAVAGGTVELPSYTEATGIDPFTVYWIGTVRWPRTDLPPGHEYRLALLESEVWETDEDVSEYLYADRSAAERLIYADHFPLEEGPIISG